MREFISGAWNLLKIWQRVCSGFLLATALVGLVNLVVEPSWIHAERLWSSVFSFLTVTALFVLLELSKHLCAKDELFSPLTRLGADVMEGIAASENRSVMVHIAGDSYMIEPVGVDNEHE